MDAQMAHPSHHAHDQHDSKAVEEGDHHEKQSVFSKVKAKARKLRDTMTNHGHGHDHDVHIPDDHDLDEEDDEDDEMVEDPKVHRAPIHVSSVFNSAVPEHQQNLGPVGGSKDMPHYDHPSRTDKAAEVEFKDPIKQTVATSGEGPKAPINKPVSFSPELGENRGNDPSRTLVPGSGKSPQSRDDLQIPIGLEEDPASPKGAHQTHTPSNYQTKVTDPTHLGAEETGVTPILSSFDKMNIYDQSEPSKQKSPQNLAHELSFGSHDQFSSGTVPKEHLDNSRTPQIGLEEDPASPKGAHQTHTPSNYQTKVSDPTHLGAEKIGVTPILSSFDKMSIYDQSEPSKQKSPQNLAHEMSFGSHDQFSSGTIPREHLDNSRTPQNPEAIQDNLEAIKPKSYPQDNPDEKPSNTTQTHKVSSPASIVAAENVDASNLGYGVKDNRTTEHDQTMQENLQTVNPELNQHENAARSSSYTEKITSATSAIADKAISAKNIVASKLGYGESVNTTGDEVHRDENFTDNASTTNSVASSTPDSGKTIPATVTEKPRPVNEKVAGAGSAVMSKMRGTTSTGNNESADNAEKVEQEKGVSMMSYIAEKLSPSDEDRALSQVISETLHKDTEARTSEAESRPVLGKVTESEEVKRRLGSNEDEASKESGGSSHPSNPVAQSYTSMLKGTVDSWLGRGGQSQQGSEESLQVGKQGKFESASGEEAEELGHNNNGDRKHQNPGN